MWAARQSQVPEQEDKMEKETQREDMYSDLSRIQPSLVHFFSIFSKSDSTILPLSLSSSNEIPLSCYLSSLQTSGVTISTIAPKSSKSTSVSHFQSESSMATGVTVAKKKTLSSLGSEPAMIGEGEDYFLSLFGDSKKPVTHSFQTKKNWKHFSMILEEVGQFRSSAFGDIKIAEVKGLFVKLINSSLDKELEIGNYILQQNVNGQRVSLFRFPPNVTMQASSTVTVWAAASEAKHQPPTDFLWKENKFRTSPVCTTILCTPNGEAIAWCTPVHWKQAWEKLETDIEFERCSIVSPPSRRHIFHWPKVETTTKEKCKETSKFQMDFLVPAFLKREKEVPPTLFPNRSPWCHSPNVPPHPYCPLITPHNPSMSESSLDRQPTPQSARPDPALKLDDKKRKIRKGSQHSYRNKHRQLTP